MSRADVEQWRQALTTFEEGMAFHRQLLDGDEVQGINPWPPPVLPAGALPSDLSDWAAELLQQSRELTDQLAQRRAGFGPAPLRRRTYRPSQEHARFVATL